MNIFVFTILYFECYFIKCKSFNILYGPYFFVLHREPKKDNKNSGEVLKFETAGGAIPYFDESQPPGIPCCYSQSGGNEKIPKTQLDYNNQG